MIFINCIEESQYMKLFFAYKRVSECYMIKYEKSYDINYYLLQGDSRHIADVFQDIAIDTCRNQNDKIPTLELKAKNYMNAFSNLPGEYTSCLNELEIE